MNAVPNDASQTTETALTVVQRAAVALNSTEHERKLLELAQGSKAITAITNNAGREQCHGARMALKRVRVDIEKIGKAAREDATAFSKACIAEERRLVSLIQPEEERLGKIQGEYDERIEAEKRARAEADARRVAIIQEKIEAIRETVLDAAGKSAADIATIIAGIEGSGIDDTFGEFRQQAEGAKASTLVRLRMLHAATEKTEAERKQLEEQRAELIRQRAAEELRAAQERERIAEEQRQARKVAEAEAARQAEVLRRQREEQEAESARVKAAQDARDAEAAERRRLQDEENERACQRNEMVMQEINAIHHQLLIADAGRAPYCKGGDLHSFDWVIEQTEQWPITTEKFGVLAGAAQKVKDSTLASLRKGRADLVKRLQDETGAQAERDRLAEESRQIEARRREQEASERQQREAREAEERRLADERAELERQQEALRLAQEAVTKPTDPVEATPAEDVRPAATSAPAEAPERPSNEEIIEAVAQAFFASEDVALRWIVEVAADQQRAAA